MGVESGVEIAVMPSSIAVECVKRRAELEEEFKKMGAGERTKHVNVEEYMKSKGFLLSGAPINDGYGMSKSSVDRTVHNLATQYYENYRKLLDGFGAITRNGSLNEQVSFIRYCNQNGFTEWGAPYVEGVGGFNGGSK